MKKTVIILGLLYIFISSMRAQTYESYTHNNLDVSVEFLADAEMEPPLFYPSCFTIFFNESGEVDAFELINPSFNHDMEKESPHGFDLRKRNHKLVFKATLHPRDNFTPAQWEALRNFTSELPLKKYTYEAFEVIAPSLFETEKGFSFWIIDGELVMAIDMYKQDIPTLTSGQEDVKRILSSFTYRAVNFQFQFDEGERLEDIKFINQGEKIRPALDLDILQIPRFRVITPENDSIRIYQHFSWDSMDIRFSHRKGKNFDPDRHVQIYSYQGEEKLDMNPDSKYLIQIGRAHPDFIKGDSLRLSTITDVNSFPYLEPIQPILIEKSAWKFYLSPKLHNYGKAFGKGNYLMIDSGNFFYTITISGGLWSDIPHFLQHLEIEGKKIRFEYDDSGNFKQLIIN